VSERDPNAVERAGDANVFQVEMVLRSPAPFVARASDRGLPVATPASTKFERVEPTSVQGVEFLWTTAGASALPPRLQPLRPRPLRSIGSP
jgi:hypothetical protein